MFDLGWQANAMREFELLGANEDKPNPLLLERLRACCKVVNSLGYKVCRNRRCLVVQTDDASVCCWSVCAPAARSSTSSAGR